MQQYPYDVALSFAGEDRIYAEALADALVRHGIEVFYDKYEKNTLWGKDLYTYLSDLYQLRLDNTQIPGLLPTIGYLSWSEETPESIADAIVEKLGKLVQNLAETKSVEKKITHELSAEYEEQIQQQVGGMIDFRQAINARDWKQAEKVLQKYPNLPEARSSLGLSMSQEVQEYFSYQLHPSNSLVGGPVTPLYRARIVQTRPAPPKLEAIHWLEEALQYQDDPEGRVTAALALMYGYSDAYDRMIDTIQKARSINPSLISYFQLPDNLMMLIYACHDLASVEEVIRNVNLKLPQKDEVQQAIREASDPKNNPYVFAQPYIEWYAVKFRTGNSSGMPVKVLIAFPGKNGLTYAQISKQGQLTITIPPQASSVIDTEKLIPIDEILKQLTDKGIVLITLT